MLKLQPDKSYQWLLWLYLLLFCVLVFGLSTRMNWLFLTMLILAPLLLLYILACELYSGVALNSWWRAEYLRGSWQYRATVIWHVVGVILLGGFAYFALQQNVVTN